MKELLAEATIHFGIINSFHTRIKKAFVGKNKITMETIKSYTSVSAHDKYSCARPKNIETMDCCKTCTSRQPNINCKFLKIETIYIKD